MKIVYIVASVISVITIIYLVDKNKKLQAALDNTLRFVAKIPNTENNSTN